MNTQQEDKSIHIPVLLQPVIDYLNLEPGDIVFDGTLGGGGYTRAISQEVGPHGRVIACDQDQDAIRRFGQNQPENVVVHHGRFSEVARYVESDSLDGAVVDLGISSDQLEETRGISFRDLEAPLDMRMNQSEDNHLTAWGILNTWNEEEIADAIYHYGEERRSRPIARSIVEARDRQEMETVGDLVKAIEQVIRRGNSKTHPATKTFQALRIVVNDELGELERFLQEIPVCMKTPSRLVVVSFHSLEDRITKQVFRKWKEEGRGTVITKKPVIADEEELVGNPRARSAKLRIFEFT